MTSEILAFLKGKFLISLIVSFAATFTVVSINITQGRKNKLINLFYFWLINIFITIGLISALNSLTKNAIPIFWILIGMLFAIFIPYACAGILSLLKINIKGLQEKSKNFWK